ncbi:MAG: efflux RND transporter periplasmic adaptor subunit, partial [Hymenobacter sp.]
MFLFLGLGTATYSTGCSSKPEEKEEQVKLLVTSPWQKD